MSEVKNKKKKSSIIQVSIGVLAVILAILIIIMMGIVSDIQGTARIVNYTGLVRGETQRLIKLELSTQQENEMIHEIKTFIDGLRNGNDELNLVRLNDVDFQNKMQELDDKFSDLYKKIYLVRFKGARNTDIIPESEEFFVICDEATGLAEKYSQKKATSLSLLEKYITADIVVLMLLIGYEFIKAWAYIRRGDANDEIIADIEAGIKKEVSVGCAMGRSVCSICGSDYGSCGHRKGESYDGQVCCAILQEPMDAYEFSFVAVPAQREAGVLKGLGCGKPKLKELADEFGAQAEYRALYQQAELGKRYQKELEDSIVRLGLSLELGVEAPVLRSIARTAAAEDLIKLRSALEERLAESMPLTTQLGGCRGKEEKVESGFLI